MSEINRACQFLPFDALKGLSEELQYRIDRRQKEVKRELTEEDEYSISEVLSKIHKGDRLNIVFFDDGKYNQTDDICIENIPTYHLLKLINNKIYYEQIYTISIL